MQKFIVFGRGRSGTTVVVDELNRHPDILCTMHSLEFDGFGADAIEPFARCPRPEAADAVEQLAGATDPLPYDWWTLREGLAEGAAKYARYLDEFEQWAERHEGCRACGFKIIDNQMTERDGLLAEIVRRRYLILNTRRRNLVRHALSGLLAEARGVYNARNYRVPHQKYHVDPRRLLMAIRNIVVHAQRWDQVLTQANTPVLYTVYEDFLEDRDAFYAPILTALGVDACSLPSSDFTKMVGEDLSDVIANYEEICALTERIGMQESLVAP